MGFRKFNSCDSNAPLTEWQASPDKISAAGGQAIDPLSSNDSVYEPHRIYGLRKMLDSFFLEVRPANTHGMTFARLRGCQP
jgi:hypothetical protein